MQKFSIVTIILNEERFKNEKAKRNAGVLIACAMMVQGFLSITENDYELKFFGRYNSNLSEVYQPYQDFIRNFYEKVLIEDEDDTQSIYGAQLSFYVNELAFDDVLKFDEVMSDIHRTLKKYSINYVEFQKENYFSVYCHNRRHAESLMALIRGNIKNSDEILEKVKIDAGTLSESEIFAEINEVVKIFSKKEELSEIFDAIDNICTDEFKTYEDEIIESDNTPFTVEIKQDEETEADIRKMVQFMRIALYWNNIAVTEGDEYSILFSCNGITTLDKIMATIFETRQYLKFDIDDLPITISAFPEVEDNYTGGIDSFNDITFYGNDYNRYLAESEKFKNEKIKYILN